MVHALIVIATQVVDNSDPILGFFRHFDYSVHLGDLLVATVLTMIGHGLRKWYKLADKFFKRIDFIGTMTERNSIILDYHTQALYHHEIIKITPEDLDEFVANKIRERSIAS